VSATELCACGCGEGLPEPRYPSVRRRFIRNHHRFKPLVGRFWEKVEKTDSCWLWRAGMNGHGYGTFSVKCQSQLAHRVSWELLRGSIPPGLDVLHNCPGGDNPACVNPDHLFLGTDVENRRDAVAKGRHAVGERIHTSRLTQYQAYEILEAGLKFERELAARFGVHVRTIKAILNRETWRHLERRGAA